MFRGKKERDETFRNFVTKLYFQVYHTLEDRRTQELTNTSRLRGRGRLITSVHHPLSIYLWKQEIPVTLNPPTNNDTVLDRTGLTT